MPGWVSVGTLVGLVLLAAEVTADAGGWYLGAGLSMATYRLSTRLDSTLESSRTLGWRLEGGHIWDPGRSRGFQLGLGATYDQWGEADEQNQIGDGREVTSTASMQAASIVFVLQQELAAWLDFTFKIGPTHGSLQAEEFVRNPDGLNYTDNFSRQGWGSQYVIGLLFFLPRHLAIEVAAQGNWFLLDGYFDAAAVGALSTSLQYRF